MFMSYQFILEQINEGKLTVPQAIQKIEKYSKQQQKSRAKKMKLLIIDNGKQLYLPEFSFGMINYFLNLFKNKNSCRMSRQLFLTFFKDVHNSYNDTTDPFW